MMTQHEATEHRASGNRPRGWRGGPTHLTLVGAEVLKGSEQRAEAACDLVLRHPHAVHERVAAARPSHHRPSVAPKVAVSIMSPWGRS